MGTDPDTMTALARWQIIAPALDERLEPAQRGRMLAQIAAQTHHDTAGRARRYTTRTLYRWVKAWRANGFEGLKPARRSDAGSHKLDPDILALAGALRAEAPARSAAQIADIVERTRQVAVGPRTLQRYFAAAGLDRARLEGRHRAFGRFEAAACGDIWTADAWDGPSVVELSSRHAQLFSILDDHSRLLPGAGFYPDVSERYFQHCLRKAIGRYGIPAVLYIDNGAAFVSQQLKLICARLGIRITHSRPYRPQGRGKKERVYRTIAEQFAVEACLAEISTLIELNRYLAAWVEQAYHHRTHTGTGQTPVQRWMAGPSAMRPAPEPHVLAAAFQWETTRAVTRTRTVSLHGNLYEVDPALVGRTVQLRYDPEDLTAVDVYFRGQPAGTATGAELRRHTDPKLRAANQPEPGPSTGICYLDALVADHAADLATGLVYHNPPEPADTDNAPAEPDAAEDGQLPGQLSIDTALAENEQENPPQ